MNLLGENQVGKVWKAYYYLIVENKINRNRKQTYRTIIFYQHFVLFFMDRNCIFLFPYFWEFAFFRRMLENVFKGKITD